MNFGINDFKTISIESENNYIIERKDYYQSMEEARKDAYRIYELMKYNAQKDNRFKGIFFLIGVSEVEGKTAYKYKVKTAGRPKYIICGNKKRPHIHICCFGEMAPSFAELITDKLNKRAYKSKDDYINRGYKSNRLFWCKKLKDNDKGVYIIPYIYKQSKYIFSYGNLDFDKIKLADYILVE